MRSNRCMGWSATIDLRIGNYRDGGGSNGILLGNPRRISQGVVYGRQQSRVWLEGSRRCVRSRDGDSKSAQAQDALRTRNCDRYIDLLFCKIGNGERRKM